MRQAQRGQFEKFDASSYRAGLVVARFNYDITEALLASARKMLARYKVPEKNIKVLRVVGSVEVPLVLQKLAQTKNYDFLVAIGAVIRGETAHFDYVAKIVSEGVLRVMLDCAIPIGFSVLTTDTRDQAVARVKAGGEAVRAAIHSAKTIKGIR